MRKKLKVLLIATATLTLSNCGFKPVNDVIHLPFNSAKISSNDANWSRQVSAMLKQFNVKTAASSSIDITTNRPEIEQNTTMLSSSGDDRSITYTASATITISHQHTQIAQHTLSASLSSYEQSAQLQSSQTPLGIRNQLQEQLINNLTFWMASDQFKKAITQHHAN